MTLTSDDRTDRFFGYPPGPGGYIVICLRSPNLDEWDTGILRRGERGNPDAPDVPAPATWGDVEWSLDHFRRFHGWDDLAIQRHRVTDGSISSAHELEHDDHFANGETDMAIPHTHRHGAEFAIAHSDHRHEEDRQALIHVFQRMPDR